MSEHIKKKINNQYWHETRIVINIPIEFRNQLISAGLEPVISRFDKIKVIRLIPDVMVRVFGSRGQPNWI